MTAEQFVDAVWMLAGAGPQTPAAPVARAEPQAKWIWSVADASQGRPAGEQIEFVHLFVLPSKPTAASVVITCDNEYTLTVNASRIGSDDEWPTVEIFDIAGALRGGGNEIRVMARNAGQTPNPAGLFLESRLIFADGSVRRIGTNELWMWNEPGAPGSARRANAWPNAAALENQRFLGDEANARIAGAIATIAGDNHFVRASLVNADRLMTILGRPNREQVVTTRPGELTTLQALELTNGEIISGLLKHGSESVAARFDRADDLITWAYRAALSRDPSDEERMLAGDFLGESPGAETISDFLWSIIMLPEFQMVR